jgi:hypothetical protein
MKFRVLQNAGVQIQWVLLQVIIFHPSGCQKELFHDAINPISSVKWKDISHEQSVPRRVDPGAPVV